MPNIFVDTSGWANLFDRSELHHAIANKIYRRIQEGNFKFLTTNYVTTELVSLLISPFRASHSKIVTIIEELQSSKFVEIIHIGPKIHE